MPTRPTSNNQWEDKTGPFDIAELRGAIKDMNNDKAVGLDGYAIEVEKYIAGTEYLEFELAMYNNIMKSGQMPEILRDVIITVLYKSRGPRDNCDSYKHQLDVKQKVASGAAYSKQTNTSEPIRIRSRRSAGHKMLSWYPGYWESMHTALVRGYIDLTKAYNKVNRELLWKILAIWDTGGNSHSHHRFS